MLVEAYEIKQLTTEDKPALLHFLRKYFYENEPLNEYLYSVQSKNIRYNYRGLYTTKCIGLGLSYKAITATGKILGVMINSIVPSSGNHIPDDYKENNPNFLKVQDLVLLAEQAIDAATVVKGEEVKEMDLKIICIHPKWRGKGIGYSLLNKTRGGAEENGFARIRTVCTSAFSAKMFENYGFECVFILKYEDYKVNGEIMFKPKEPHVAMKGLILKL